MAAIVEQYSHPPATHAGLRVTADEFFALDDDGHKYELIDGVVVMSPSPTPRHQLVAKIILRQLDDYVERGKLGLVLYETDVHFRTREGAPDLVYRPEIIFFTVARVSEIRGRIDIVPDLIVEIVSPDSRSLDTRTKLTDYERAGVREYWVIDPLDEQMTFYRLSDGKYVESHATISRYESEIVPGFALDLDRVRAAFSAL